MVELVPLSIGRLADRMFRELEVKDAIFDLPRAKFFLGGDDDLDFRVRFHGLDAGSPLGPAAGPQSQLAQNIVLSWLGGARIFELKTVQVDDRLAIPRPCIDMRSIGFNVEWSQELRLEQSADEYVKAAMLIELLVASRRFPTQPGFGDLIFDMSVGYDLDGIRSDGVRRFLDAMVDCRAHVERLRDELPRELGDLRGLPFPSRLSNTLTLSTFHGCPPDEIEAIIDHLFHTYGLSCVVKLNPTLLGKDEARHLLHDVLGYRDLVIPDSAFDKDTTWEQAVGFIDRLAATARKLEVGFGVKFSNTLIVEHDGVFLPESEAVKYLSGPPLHVLAMNLVHRVRRKYGAGLPISFSAGVDRWNFKDAVALGLVPITVCSDLLKPGGYARQKTYFDELAKRMREVGATSVDDYVIRSGGHAEDALVDVGERAAEGRAALASGEPLRAAVGDDVHGRWVAAAMVRNTESYVERATGDPRYSASANAKPPKKIGSQLELFNCVTCDKCVPVCPNDANFTLRLDKREVPVVLLRRDGERVVAEQRDPIVLDQRHQIAHFADFCNECGNCDVFCPEDGGPYLIKPRFFGSVEEWRRYPDHDGFHVERDGEVDRVHARIGGREVVVTVEPSGRVAYAGAGFDVTFDRADPAGTLDGELGDGPIDLTLFLIADLMREAVLDRGDVTYVA